MQKKITIALTIVLLSALFFTVWINSGQANEPFSRYQYLTNFETTRFNEIIWFWHRDTLWGKTHSNDYIGLKYTPHFYDPLSTSKEHYFSFQLDPHFEYPVQFGAPIRRFPEQFTEAREEGLVIGDPDEGLQYRLILDEKSAILWAWRLGMPFHEVDSLRQEISIAENPVIFIDSPLELMGELDGVLTVGCSHDILLIDDVRYISGDRVGHFDPDECEDMLGVVSERNIIIANTFANGKEDGIHEQPGNLARHSIILNGAFLALNESFTFQHQNDDFDHYQGWEPDERGIIHLTGSVAQWRKGYVHRANHQGTGYGKDYLYDPRFEQQSPPMFPEVVRYDIPGRGNRLDLKRDNSPYHLVGMGEGDGYDSIRAEAGTEIILHENFYLKANRPLILEGTENAPIVITRENADQIDSLMIGLMCGNDSAEVLLRHVRLERGVALELRNSQITIENCQFFDKVTLKPEIATDANITGSIFHSGLAVTGERRAESELILTHSVIENGMLVAGWVDSYIRNNNFLSSDSSGLKMIDRRDNRVLNNIFAHNRYGYVASYGEGPDSYNCYWDNDTNRVGVHGGDNSIHEDPRFADPENGNYRFQWNSPCIDAGDPDSPHDPDSTTADIGAFYRDRNLTVSDALTLPRQFKATASPNPFNSATTVSFTMPRTGVVKYSVHDILGRELLSGSEQFEAGGSTITLNGDQFGTAGLYFIRLTTEVKATTVKLVYVP